MLKSIKNRRDLEEKVSILWLLFWMRLDGQDYALMIIIPWKEIKNETTV